jgi:hypothetical protein
MLRRNRRRECRLVCKAAAQNRTYKKRRQYPTKIAERLQPLTGESQQSTHCA